MDEPLLQARSIVKKAARAGFRLAGASSDRRPILDQVDLTIEQGVSVGLIGESGSGRTTLARILAGLDRADDGVVEWRGQDVSALKRGEWKAYRRAIQCVFRDPLPSMNPRRTIHAMLETPMCALTDRDKKARAFVTDEVLAAVALSPEVLKRHPDELSADQLRRVALARALIVEPQLVILDRPTSGLDWSEQAPLLNLLADIREQLRVTYLLICDQLPVVERLCERVTVLQTGQVVEQGSSAQVLNQPRDAYTRQLCAAVPRLPSDDGSRGQAVNLGRTVHHEEHEETQRKTESSKRVSPTLFSPAG